MEETLSMAERIQQIVDDPKWSNEDKEIVINNMKRRFGWIDLMTNLDIQMSPEEEKIWAEDIKTYDSSSPSAFLQYMNTWETPDNQKMWYKWNNSNTNMTPTGIVSDTSSSSRYLESWGDKKYITEYIQYLRILHNYLDQIEVPKQVFGNIPNSLFNTEGWYRKALMNGSLLYRKLLEKGAIEYGTKLNLWESFSRSELMGLIGLDVNGQEMSGEQQAQFIQNMAQSYVSNGGKKADPNEPLPEAIAEDRIATKDKFILQNIKSADQDQVQDVKPQSEKTTINNDANNLDPELNAIIEKKRAIMERVERLRSRLPLRQRFGIALADNFVFWRKNVYEKIDAKYDALYAAIVDKKYPQKSLRQLVKEAVKRWAHKNETKPVIEAKAITENTTPVLQVKEKSDAKEKTLVQKTTTAEPVKAKRKRASKPRKVLNEWRVARTTQTKPSKSAEKPIEKTSVENGNTVTTLFYPKANKIVRITQFRNGMKKISTIFIERKRDGISGKVATYYERTRKNAQGEQVTEHLASLTGEMTYGKAGIYVNSHDGIARKVSYLSHNELAHWKQEMTKVKIMKHKQAVQNRRKVASKASVSFKYIAENDMVRAS